MVSRYSAHSHIPEQKFTQLMHGFIMDIDASKIAQVLGLNRNTVNRYFHLLRARIAAECQAQWQGLSLEELPESASPLLYGVIVLHQKVHVHPLKNETAAHGACLGTIDGRTKQCAIDKGKSHPEDTRLLREFFSFIEQRLSRFRGMHDSTFAIHLAECEWRFNHRGEDLFILLLESLRHKRLPSLKAT